MRLQSYEIGEGNSAHRPNHVLDDDTGNNDSGEEHLSFYERDQNKLLTRQAQC